MSTGPSAHDAFYRSDIPTTGRKRQSNREKGEEIFRRMAQHLADVEEEVRSFPVEIARRDYQDRA